MSNPERHGLPTGFEWSNLCVMTKEVSNSHFAKQLFVEAFGLMTQCFQVIR